MALPVKIDAEFKGLIPPCTPEERAAIRQSIVDSGLLSPLVVWEETGILLDGHNRYEICREIKFQPRPKKDWTFISLPDRRAARLWILQNQIARRNLSGDQLSILRGTIYSERKQSEPFQEVLVGQNDQPVQSVAEIVAKEFGVSPSTIQRDEKFSDAVAALPPDVQAVVRAGKSDIPRKDIIAAAPLRCKKCTRLKMTEKDCPQCQLLQDEHKAKKNAKNRTDKKKVKSGSMRFDWAKAESEMGVVVRHSDRVADGYELPKNTGKHQKAQDLINTYVDFMKEWKKELTKS